MSWIVCENSKVYAGAATEPDREHQVSARLDTKDQGSLRPPGLVGSARHLSGPRQSGAADLKAGASPTTAGVPAGATTQKTELCLLWWKMLLSVNPFFGFFGAVIWDEGVCFAEACCSSGQQPPEGCCGGVLSFMVGRSYVAAVWREFLEGDSLWVWSTHFVARRSYGTRISAYHASTRRFRMQDRGNY